jgi:hypothetical protein
MSGDILELLKICPSPTSSEKQPMPSLDWQWLLLPHYQIEDKILQKGDRAWEFQEVRENFHITH